MLKRPLKELFIGDNDPIRSAIACIDRGGLGIALVVDDGQQLMGTISDGDIRRAMLAGIDLNSPVSILLERKANTQYAKPITALLGTAPDVLISLMRRYVLTVIPIVDEHNCVVDLIAMDELIPSDSLPLQAVIMAGGLGARLRPLTEQTPKPMLPVGGRPLMEVILERLRLAGIQKVNITTHYLPERITEHFGDGRAFGVDISYVNEEQPLGTGGALGLLEQPAGPLLVVNGDVLTQVNYRAMLAFHNENHADMTVGVRKYEFDIPYGVVECEGARITGLQEKPRMGYFVNAGLYLLNPSVYDFIPHGQHFNMTDLIQWLIDAKRPVISFPVSEYWLDVGQYTDYAKAQTDMEDGLMGNKHTNIDGAGPGK